MLVLIIVATTASKSPAKVAVSRTQHSMFYSMCSIAPHTNERANGLLYSVFRAGSDLDAK